MKLALHIPFLVCFSLYWFPSWSSDIVWSGQTEITAVQGESTTLVWNVTLLINKAWTFVKIHYAEGVNTREIVTFKKTGEQIIHIPSYESRRSDITFDVSQSGLFVTIRFTLANLNRTMDMRNYKPELGFSDNAYSYPKVTALTILVKPYSVFFEIEPQQDAFCLGDKVNLTCRADGIPPPQISLSLNNHLVQNGNTSVEVAALPLNAKGENDLICVPNNSAGVGQTRSIKLTVKEPPNIIECKINDEEVTSKLVIEGTKVIISCDVTGSQPRSIAWYQPNVQRSLSQSNILTIDSINRDQSGQYRVTAYNGKECEKTVTKILQLTVMYLDKPVVQGNAYKVVNPKNPDHEARFKITVDGSPHPSLTCDREGVVGNVTVARTVSGSITTFSVTVYISNPFVGDEEYICKLSNTGGTRRINFHLYKKNPPISVRGTFTLTNVTWTEDLNNHFSTFYSLIKEKVTEALNLVYGNEEFVSRVKITRFMKGSVKVNFELQITANVTDPILLLQNVVEKNGGQLNGLIISTTSIRRGYSGQNDAGKVADGSLEVDDDKYLPLGLGLGLGFLVLVLLSLVVFCWWCKRKAVYQPRYVGGRDGDHDRTAGAIAVYQPRHVGGRDGDHDRTAGGSVILEHEMKIGPDGTRKVTKRMIMPADYSKNDMLGLQVSSSTDRRQTGKLLDGN